MLVMFTDDYSVQSYFFFFNISVSKITVIKNVMPILVSSRT